MVDGINDEELEKFALKPLEGVTNGLDCAKGVVCPKGVLVWPREGAVELKSEDDCVLEKFRPVLNVEEVPGAEAELKRDGPNPDELAVLKRDEEEAAVNPVVGNREGVDDEVDPKGDADEALGPELKLDKPGKGELLKFVFGANGLEAGAEKRLEGVEEKGLEEG